MRLLGIAFIALCFGALGGFAFAHWYAPRIAQSTDAGAGPIEVGFAQSMSAHHQQAIDMALLMLQDEPGPLDVLARSILYQQLRELGQMQGWLRLWEAPLQRIPVDMEWLLATSPLDDETRQYLLDCEQSPTGMPGLASAEQMEHLRQARGRARDRLFIQLMKAHHEGGLPMARIAARHSQLPAVRQLAAHIVREQSEELLRLQQTAAAMGPPVD